MKGTRSGALYLRTFYHEELRRCCLAPTTFYGLRDYSQSTITSQVTDKESSKSTSKHAALDPAKEEEELGAMSRRLEEMTERTVEESGRSARKHVEEAGFSEELRQKLEARIAESSFRNENAAAFAQVNLPSGAGKGTRDIAAAEPWSGTEKLEDSALRMLNDAYKPLRGTRGPKIPAPRGPPANVDLRMRKAVQKSRVERLANARDKTSIYALSQDSSITEKEREQMRKQLKERFTAGARPMPTSVQGLAALANERIEDAIARGQFKNIPRGKGTNIERDYTASSPFLDTTEYFMNKIIQKQEIVPPWIEKQQELVKAAAVFRSRLRADWKRHAARVIASKGGPLDAQVRRAEAYAAAEAAYSPRVTKAEALTGINAEGKLSQITVTETQSPANAPEDSKITVAESLLGPSTDPSPQANPSSPTSSPAPLAPFRDPAWEALELPYQTLALSQLNSLTRSYNLMAPDLAKKPYFNLVRELRAAFADVAPQLANEISERARAPARIKVEVIGHRPGGVLEKFGGEKVKVWDEKRPGYGFKEFWRDLWGGSEEKRG